MTRADDFAGYSVKELRELKGRIDLFIAEKQKTQRSELRTQMLALAADAGLSIDEIFNTSRKGSIVAPKYRNPEDHSQTWTGRGRMPMWLNEKLKKRGTSKEDFAI